MKLYLCCQRLERDNLEFGIPSFPSTSTKLNGLRTEGEGPSEFEGKIHEVSNAIRVHRYKSMASRPFLAFLSFETSTLHYDWRNSIQHLRNGIFGFLHKHA
jgi:hypothetical protein